MKNKERYKRYMDKITVDFLLLEDTSKKIEEINNKKSSLSYPKIHSVASIFIIIGLLFFISQIFKHSKNEPLNVTQIEENYVAFNATTYNKVKSLAPEVPRSYDALVNESKTIIVCTIEDIGVFRKKSEQYYPCASFGTYIYSAKVDKIIYGTMDNKVGDIIPIVENAWAIPKEYENGHEVKEWEFLPYTDRPDDFKNLYKGNQYVICLDEKDETDCYNLSFDGFGIFSVEYIEKEQMKNSFEDLSNYYHKNDQYKLLPMKDNIRYRLCSLFINNKYLKQN